MWYFDTDLCRPQYSCIGALWVERSLRVWKGGASNLGWVKSKSENLAPVASLDGIYQHGWLS